MHRNWYFRLSLVPKCFWLIFHFHSDIFPNLRLPRESFSSLVQPENQATFSCIQSSHCVVFHRGGLSALRIVFAFSQFAVSGDGGRKYVIISSPRRLRMLGGPSEFGKHCSATHATSSCIPGPTPFSSVGTVAGSRNANGTEKRQQSY